jgi:hypothetical protein
MTVSTNFTVHKNSKMLINQWRHDSMTGISVDHMTSRSLLQNRHKDRTGAAHTCRIRAQFLKVAVSRQPPGHHPPHHLDRGE